MAQGRPASNSRGAWYGAAFLLAAVLELSGAWRMIRHHDGTLLVVLPVVSLAIFSGLLARRGEHG